MKSVAALSSFALVATAAGHTIFQQIGINGAQQTRLDFMRVPSYDGPQTDVTSTSLACNGDPNPLVDISPNVATVPAGSSFDLYWAQTLTTDYATGLIIDPSHKGPIMAYMAKVNSATGAIPNNGWFKIYEDGYTASTGQWAVDKLIANDGKVTVTIPSCLEEGDYLLRGEIIALHAATSYPGAQLYMECAQIHVTSSGSTVSPATYSIPGIYKPADVTFNLYTTFSSYTIPGPAVFSCSGNNAPAPTTTKAVASTTLTTSVVKTSSVASSTPTSASGTVAEYGQCGGVGWTGGTACVSGSTCVVLNDYYSQCQ